ITTAANLSPNIGNIFAIGDIDLWDVTGNNYNYDQHREQENVAADSEIEITNLFGDVEVRPADTDRIVIDVRKTIRAADKEDADRRDQEFSFSIDQEGSKYLVRSNRDQSGFRGGPRQRFKSSLTVQVPKRAAVHVDNRNGRVFLQDLIGNQGFVSR